MADNSQISTSGEGDLNMVTDAQLVAIQELHARRVWRAWASLFPMLLVVPITVAYLATRYWDFSLIVSLIWWLACVPLVSALGRLLIVRPRLNKIAHSYAEVVAREGLAAEITIRDIEPGDLRDALFQLLPRLPEPDSASNSNT